MRLAAILYAERRLSLDDAWISQMRKGLAELSVLAFLKEREAYGYEILRDLRDFPGLSFKESTLYPVLARLTKNKLLSVRTAPSESGPPRRYYKLTPKGRSQLQKMIVFWRSLRDDIETLSSNKKG